MKEPYGSYCAGLMFDLLRKYPKSFWASPNEFFTGKKFFLLKVKLISLKMDHY